VPTKQKIVAVMPVRNESGRYLREALTHLVRWVDAIVVLDDASDDDTFEVAASFPKVLRYRNNVPEYRQEAAGLRSRLWRLASRENPDWILAINADEIFEDRIINEVGFLIGQEDYDVIYFRVFDFWKSDIFYRIDGPWNPWKNFLPLMVRYRPDLGKANFGKKGGFDRLPDYFTDAYAFYSDIRVRHFGWAREEEHESRYLRCREEDLKISGEESSRTQSVILPDARVSLEKWAPSKPLYFLDASWDNRTGG
jgi:glycosyltransferase involved in cell wall biosynthesis